MAKKRLTLEDLRIDPKQLGRFADQLKDAPDFPDARWIIPSMRIGEKITASADWNEGPAVKIEIQFEN